MDSCPVCQVCHRGFSLAENRVLITDCSCGPQICYHPYHYEHTGCYDGSRGGAGL